MVRKDSVVSTEKSAREAGAGTQLLETWEKMKGPVMEAQKSSP